MAIINRKHPDIANTSSERAYIFMSIQGDNEFRFTAGAVRLFKLEAGKFLHFDNGDTDNTKWTFYQSDNEDGFRLQRISRDKSLTISNKALVKMFRKSTRYTEGNPRFMLLATRSEVKGSPIVEIHTKQPYDKFVK